MQITIHRMRKLNLKQYGGKEYESEDVAITATEEAGDDPKGMYTKLSKFTDSCLEELVASVIKKAGTAKCSNTACQRKANLQYGTLCFTCNKMQRDGWEPVPPRPELKVTANGAPDFSN